jgi:hypothetical protein
MNRQRNSLLFAAALLVLLPALACPGQTAPPPIEFNTAGAGAPAADIEAAVGLICPAPAITRSKDASASGCSVCPRVTDFHGYGHSSWEMYAETSGHFTAPQDDNLLLDGTGCDSDASNNGGSFMFSFQSGKPRLLKYNRGLVTSQCHKFAYADGRDFLVCKGGRYLQGEGVGAVFMASFGTDGNSVTTNLITATDTTGTCGSDRSTVVRESDIKDIHFSPKSPGSTNPVAPGESTQIAGLTITATLGNVKCSQVAAGKKTGSLPASVKTLAIEFQFDGKHFNVAPASRAALNRFNGE